jgi:uncharacterized protein (DUF2267 family)
VFLTHPEPPYPTIAPNLRATMEKTLEWVHELQDISGFPSETQAWAAMRAVLHTLRDRLTPDEAADLASQMPMLLRGMYYEGYNPGSTPLRLRTREQFIEIVERRLGNHTRIHPEFACRAVFDLLDRRISRGEILDVRRMLPADIRWMWPPA